MRNYNQKYYYSSKFIILHLKSRENKFKAAAQTMMYIILSKIGIPMHIKATALKSNKPIDPQLREPIKTSIKDNLSNMFSLHILLIFLSKK